MEKEHLTEAMVGNILAGGRMESKMGKGSMLMRVGGRGKGSGDKGRG